MTVGELRKAIEHAHNDAEIQVKEIGSYFIKPIAKVTMAESNVVIILINPPAIGRRKK